MVQTQSTQKKSNKSGKVHSTSKWIYLFSGGIIAIIIAIYFLLPDFQAFVGETYQVLTSGDRQHIAQYVKGFGIWGPLVIIFTMVIQMFLLIVPSWLLMIVAVLAYGQFWGVVLSVVAVFVASSVAYFIGSLLGEATIYKLLGEKTKQKTETYLQEYGFGAVALFRLAPFLSNDAISLLGGMLRMNYLKFAGATLAGIIPLAALIGFFGENTDQLKAGLMWIGGVSLVLYIVYIIYQQRKKKDAGAKSEYKL